MTDNASLAGNSKTSRVSGEFGRLAQLASAAGVGAMGAFLWALEGVVPEIKMRFSFGVVVAFALTAAVTWFFWKNVLLAADATDDSNTVARRRKAWIIGSGLFLLAGTVAAFGHPILQVSAGEASKVVQGVLIALAVLTVVGGMFYRVIQFLQQDDENNALAASPKSPSAGGDSGTR